MLVKQFSHLAISIKSHYLNLLLKWMEKVTCVFPHQHWHSQWVRTFPGPQQYLLFRWRVRGLIFHGDLKETCRSITDSPAGRCGPLWSWRRTHLFKSKTRNEVHCPAGSTQPRYIFSPHHPFQIILHLAVSSSPRMGLETRIKYFKSQQLQNKQNRSFWRVVVCGLARRKE